MNQRKPLVFELLNKSQNKVDFSCGVEILDNYLKVRAGQEMRRNVSFSYVMTYKDESQVLGYYTLSASSAVLETLPHEIAKQTRYESIPAVLIGRLALDKSLHGQKLGRFLLMDALQRIVRSGVFAVKVIMVEPKDKTAAKFYENFGFSWVNDNQMFLPFETVKSMF